jgi:hypothetical protein
VGQTGLSKSLDPNFGTGGTVTTTFTGGTLTPIGALELSNGDIVVLSQFDFVGGFGTQIALTRYTSAGMLGSTFRIKEHTFTSFSSVTFDPFAFAELANGDIVVAGTATTSAGVLEFALTQFSADLVLDMTFGANGVAATQIGTRPDAPSAFLLQPNGQFLMGAFEDGGAGHSDEAHQFLLPRFDERFQRAARAEGGLPFGFFDQVVHLYKIDLINLKAF